MFIGLDVHKKYSYGTILDEDGEVFKQGKFLNSFEELDEFLADLDEPAQVTMEACGIWNPLHDHLQSQGHEVTVAHPLKLRAIAEARVKTDKIDSRILADLLRVDMLPKSYVPDPSTRELRMLVRHRAMLVRVQTSIKNRIHQVLTQLGIGHPYSDLFGKQGMRFLQELSLTTIQRLALDNYLAVLAVLRTQIMHTSKFLHHLVLGNKQVELLESVPGIGTYTAALIISEIGSLDRFADAKKLCAYAGVVPSVHQSGNTLRYGHITKQGSPWLRWILVQAVHQALRSQNPHALKRFYAKLEKRKGKKIAIVACARKLLTYIYLILKEGITFQQLRVNQTRAPR
jgi:transposase